MSGNDSQARKLIEQRVTDVQEQALAYKFILSFASMSPTAQVAVLEVLGWIFRGNRVVKVLSTDVKHELQKNIDAMSEIKRSNDALASKLEMEQRRAKTLQELDATVKTTMEDIVRLEQVVHVNKEHLARLQEEDKRLNAALRDIKGRSSKLLPQLRKAEIQVANAHDQLEEYAAMVISAETTKTHMHVHIDRLRADCIHLQDEMVYMDQQCTELRSRIKLARELLHKARYFHKYLNVTS